MCLIARTHPFSTDPRVYTLSTSIPLKGYCACAPSEQQQPWLPINMLYKSFIILFGLDKTLISDNKVENDGSVGSIIGAIPSSLIIWRISIIPILPFFELLLWLYTPFRSNRSLPQTHHQAWCSAQYLVYLRSSIEQSRSRRFEISANWSFLTKSIMFFSFRAFLKHQNFSLRIYRHIQEHLWYVLISCILGIIFGHVVKENSSRYI